MFCSVLLRSRFRIFLIQVVRNCNLGGSVRTRKILDHSPSGSVIICKDLVPDPSGDKQIIKKNLVFLYVKSLKIIWGAKTNTHHFVGILKVTEEKSMIWIRSRIRIKTSQNRNTAWRPGMDGLCHEMDWAFDDMHGLVMGRGKLFNFFRGSSDLILKRPLPCDHWKSTCLFAHFCP
jgi:hypothetical protein